MRSLGQLYFSQGDYDKAEPNFINSLAIFEKAYGPNHKNIATSLHNLGALYKAQGHFEKSEPLLLRAISITEKEFGSSHLNLVASLHSLGLLYHAQGNIGKAEPLLIRALSINESANGELHTSTAKSLNNLAGIYQTQGAFAKAQRLHLRALAINEKILGPDHSSIATTLNNLASLYEKQKQYAKAEALHLRALSIKERVFGKGHLNTANSLNNLAGHYTIQGDYRKAAPFIQSALKVFDLYLGPDHPSVGSSMNTLATLYMAEGEYSKAKDMFKRALLIFGNNFGPDHPDVALTHAYLAELHKSQRELNLAHFHYQSAAGVLKRRTFHGMIGNTRARASADSELKDNISYFYTHAHMSSLLASEQPEKNTSLLAEAYSSSQFALRTSAGAALGQAAARFAAKDDALSETVRQRQDLTGEWSAVNERLTSSITASDKDRNKDLEQTYRDRLVAIDGEMADIDTRLEADFPEYFALTSPKPLGVEETQELLYDNEALVMFLSGDEGTLVFALTKDKVDWTLVDVDASVLEEAVRVLRVSLENPQRAFPRGQAHGIYKKLMSVVEELVSDKDHVFLVPSGALGSIPMGVLVTKEPEGDDRSPEALRETKWWGTQQALTSLPSISSLKALRLLVKDCLLYTSPSPRDATLSRMPSSA